MRELILDMMTRRFRNLERGLVTVEVKSSSILSLGGREIRLKRKSFLA